ncbi:carboxymuconolactone decarboxylase family protein [Parapusillimonas sp. SGNA-6]|nr:carboxymuconolactone decarboxylase family protein [Parapusillimonas sp. SGNA-6]
MLADYHARSEQDVLAQNYRDMAGFLPPRVEARLAITGSLDPKMVEFQEQVRAHALNTDCFDEKMVQLIIFGMLVCELSDAAVIHGVAARKAGATWKEMQSIINLAFVFRGVSAANRGADMLLKIADKERQLQSA